MLWAREDLPWGWQAPGSGSDGEQRCSAQHTKLEARASASQRSAAPITSKLYGGSPGDQRKRINEPDLDLNDRMKPAYRSGQLLGSGGPSSTRRQPEVHRPPGLAWRILMMSVEDWWAPGCEKPKGEEVGLPKFQEEEEERKEGASRRRAAERRRRSTV